MNTARDRRIARAAAAVRARAADLVDTHRTQPPTEPPPRAELRQCPTCFGPIDTVYPEGHRCR